jgi:hypothetical protein
MSIAAIKALLFTYIEGERMKITAVKTLPFAYAFQGAHASKYLRGQSVKCLFVGVETATE